MQAVFHFNVVKLLLAIQAVFLGSLAVAQNQAYENHKSSEPQIIIQLQIDGPVGPATSDYITRNLDKAAEINALLVLIRIDTPGGLDTSMRVIIKKIIASSVPVVSYVAPSGARAASAGTYIIYSSHVAAMAPATNLGAATPVQLINPTQFSKNKSSEKQGQEQQEPVIMDDPMAHKIINDAVAYIRGLAKMRGRNEQWAEKAVREAASIPAEEALAHHVIDVLANNEADLISQLDQRKVNVLGRDIILSTQHAIIEEIDPDWRSELLSVITNPNVAYILMLVGIYGLIFEFSNPGSVVPGTVGAICLLLALFAFQVLPISYAGMALILLGIALMITEAFVPSIGILGFGGVISFVIGSVILMDTDAPGFGINPGLIGGFALSSALFFILALGLLVKSRQVPVVTGREELIGKTGEALADFNDTGMVRIHSENWKARTDIPLHKHEKVKVYDIDGLTLLVTPYQQQKQE